MRQEFTIMIMPSFFKKAVIMPILFQTTSEQSETFSNFNYSLFS